MLINDIVGFEQLGLDSLTPNIMFEKLLDEM